MSKQYRYEQCTYYFVYQRDFKQYMYYVFYQNDQLFVIIRIVFVNGDNKE
jgi:hypothetical protein